MTFCAVPGCGSDSRITKDCTFHRIPTSLIPRARWVLALGPLPDGCFVCSRHFDVDMFMELGNKKTLKLNAVPKPFPVSSPKDKPSPNLSECSDEAGSSGELVACRVCLAADGRLYAISGSGLEDSLAALTGVALSAEKGFPRHLCAICFAKLSKCAAFRDSCQRSTKLLKTLADMGPLKMNVIKAFNKRSKQLTNKLSLTKVFQFGTTPLLEITPLIKTNERKDLHEEADYTEVEYLESEEFLIQEASDHHRDEDTFESLIQEREIHRNEIKQAKLNTENPECEKDGVKTGNPGMLSESDDDYTDTIENRAKFNTENPKCKEDGVKTGNPGMLSESDDDYTDTLENRAKFNTENPKCKEDGVKTGNPGMLSESDDDYTDTIEKRAKFNTENPKCKEDGVKTGNPGMLSESDDDYTDTSEKQAIFNTENPKCKEDGVKTGNPSMLSESDDDYTDTLETSPGLKTEEDLAFEKEFNFEVIVLSKEEQMQEIDERNRQSSSAYACDVCGKGYPTESLMTRHKTSKHHPSAPYECNMCGHRFRRVYMLRWHREQHRAVLKCRECGYISPNRSQARSHCSMHKGTKYTCPHCQRKFVCPSSYYAHIRLRHPSKNEACDQCGETFMGKAGLRIHKRIRHFKNDKSNLNYKCPVCDVAFETKEALQRHLKLSVGVSHAALWPCAACGESCGSDAARAAHAAEKHSTELHYCKECDKSFSNEASFERHMDWKHRDRAPSPTPTAPARPQRPRCPRGSAPSGPYVCEMCGKVYQNLVVLEYHMNGHLGLKPFKCPHCPKAFSSQTKHMLHMRVHTGERPYQCEQCPLAFALRCNYTRHLNVVHLRKQAKCDLCGKVMGASSLYTHVRSVHMNIKQVRPKRDRTKNKQDLVTES